LIHNVYVIAPGGEPLISLKFGSIDAPDILVSGFLSAIQSFAKQVIGSDVHEMTTGNFAVMMCRVGDNLVVVSSDHGDKEARVRLDEITTIVEENLGKLPNEILVISKVVQQKLTAADRAKLWAEKGL